MVAFLGQSVEHRVQRVVGVVQSVAHVGLRGGDEFLLQIGDVQIGRVPQPPGQDRDLQPNVTGGVEILRCNRLRRLSSG